MSYAFEKSGEEEVYIHENSTKCLRAGKKSIGTNSGGGIFRGNSRGIPGEGEYTFFFIDDTDKLL